jgi:hypothetical protein
MEAPAAMGMECSIGMACFQTVSIGPVLVYLALHLPGLEVFHSNHEPERLVRSSA